MLKPTPLQQAAELLTRSEHERARQLLVRQLRRTPRDPEVHRLLAIAANQAGQLDQAAFYAGRAAELGGTADLHVFHGNALFNLGKADAAAAAYRAALKVDPGHAQARAGMCEILFQHSRFAEVIAECREGLRHTPADGDLRSTLAAAYINTGRGEEAYALMRETAQLRPLDGAVASGVAQTTTYLAGVTPAEVVGAHRRFGEIMERVVPTPARPPVRNPYPARRVRVGFLSGDFRTHSVAFFFEPLLEHLKARHPRDLELACYYTTLTVDKVTERLRGKADLWRDIAQLSIPDMAAAIRRDNVDILIEMSGHTDSSRLAVMQYRPAPVQVTYLGYPATSGLRTIDFRVVDTLTDPPSSESHCVEELVRLDPSFLCYRPPIDAPQPELTPNLRGTGGAEGGVVFGSFNVLQKINDPLLRRWKRVLDAVPGSRLLLKNHGLIQAEIRESMGARLVGLGYRPEQFELVSKQASMREHLATYGRVDVALDTFPYHGTTTTCDALYMGVPVVTMAGPMHASRVGVSLLTNVGLEELIAADEEEFIATAVPLARDVERRAELRRTLRPCLLASPICDEPGYADRFAAMLRGLWSRACAGSLR
ncbi:MAG TPA: tetratricopeptide repeat protein [Phycisphaerales bacterium]|nr:tetratricopeptide repeat protein [Phycisphaerales bacterium]